MKNFIDARRLPKVFDAEADESGDRLHFTLLPKGDARFTVGSSMHRSAYRRGAMHAGQLLAFINPNRYRATRESMDRVAKHIGLVLPPPPKPKPLTRAEFNMNTVQVDAAGRPIWDTANLSAGLF